MAVVIDGTTGITTPALDSEGNLDVNGTIQGGFINSTGSIYAITGIFRSSDGTAASPSIQPGLDNDTGFFRAANNTIGFSTGGTEKVRITQPGNVGIGTSSPTTTVDITRTGGEETGLSVFNGSSSASASAKIRVGINNTFCYEIFRAGNSANIVQNATQSGANIIWQVAGTESARIDTSGAFLVGTTNTSPASNNVSGVAITPSGISATGGAAISINRNSNGIVQSILRSGSLVGNISVTTTATAYNTSSDYRLKEDAQPVLNPIDRLMQLKPINFAWKADGSRVDGFLAHEAQAVVPEAVTGQKDAVDKDGKPEYQGIDQSKLVPLLTAAIQELKAELDTVKAELNTLKGN